MKTLALSVSLLGVLAAAGLSAPAAITSSRGAPTQQSPVRTRAPETSAERWERQLVLTPEIAARLVWARKTLPPSGIRKLERLALGAAPAIASGTGFAALRKQAEADTVTAFPGLSGLDVSESAFIVLALATSDIDDDLRLIMAEVKATNQAKQKLRDQIKQLNEWISQQQPKGSKGSKASDLEKAGAPRGALHAAATTQKTKPKLARGSTLEKAFSPVLHVEYARQPVIPPLPPKRPGLTIEVLAPLRDERMGKLDDMNEMSEMTSLRLQMVMDRRSKFIATLSNIMKKTETTQDILVQNLK